MKSEGKSKQFKILMARIGQNVKDIENLSMADLYPWWPTLEEKAKAVSDDLRILLPLAAEMQPYMVKRLNTLKEAVVNMRISAYNLMNDVTQSAAAGKPVHQEKEICEAMKAHGITHPNSPRGIGFCTHECPYQARCLAIEPDQTHSHS